MLDWIAEVMGARRARRGVRIQSLWRGYGELFRVELDGGRAPTAVVKWVRPPAATTDSVSDARKRRSYEVEAAFYRDHAGRCDDSCRVAGLYGSRVIDDEHVFVLEDLDAAGFPRRHHDAGPTGIAACLTWLAAFHARFLGDPGAGLWSSGTYWHLATRAAELAVIDEPVLRELAPELDARLAAARYQTLLHGDAKEANFCFAGDDGRVAAVDFQYAGRGCAMKDVAYLLHGRAEDDERELAFYFARLRDAHPAGDLEALEAEWRELYPIARLDFCRFLAGWHPATWRRDLRGQRELGLASRRATL